MGNYFTFGKGRSKTKLTTNSSDSGSVDQALPAYRAELWKLKDRNHEEKEDYEENSEAVEVPEEEEKEYSEENQKAEDQDTEENLKEPAKCNSATLDEEEPPLDSDDSEENQEA